MRHFVYITNVYKTPLPFYAAQKFVLSLIQSYQPIIIKGRNCSQSWNPYTHYCFSSVEYLLKYHFESKLIYKWRYYRQTILNVMVSDVDIIGLCYSVTLYDKSMWCEVPTLPFQANANYGTVGLYHFKLLSILSISFW